MLIFRIKPGYTFQYIYLDNPVMLVTDYGFDVRDAYFLDEYLSLNGQRTRYESDIKKVKALIVMPYKRRSSDRSKYYIIRAVESHEDT